MKRGAGLRLVLICVLAVLCVISFVFAAENLSGILSNDTTDSYDDFLEKESGIFYEGLEGYENDSSGVLFDDLGGAYVSVDDYFFDAQINESIDSKLLGDINMTFGEITQRALEQGKPVMWDQQLLLENIGSSSIEFTINLWSHDDVYNRSFLWDVLRVNMTTDNELLSQTPIGVVTLAPGEKKLVDVYYETPVVTFVSTCFEITVADLIPADATIISSTVDMTAIVEEVCTGSIEYDSSTRYKAVELIV